MVHRSIQHNLLTTGLISKRMTICRWSAIDRRLSEASLHGISLRRRTQPGKRQRNRLVRSKARTIERTPIVSQADALAALDLILVETIQSGNHLVGCMIGSLRKFLEARPV